MCGRGVGAGYLKPNVIIDLVYIDLLSCKSDTSDNTLHFVLKKHHTR